MRKDIAKMKVGVMYGSFNPFTTAHRSLCKIVKNNEGLDKVIVVPNNQNAYSKNLISNADRSEIISLSIQDEEGFEVGSLAMETDEHLKFYDILQYYKEQNDDAEMYLIMGYDTIDILEKYYGEEEQKIKRLVSDHHIVISTRGGNNPEDRLKNSDTLSSHIENFSCVLFNNTISSTAVRDCVKKGIETYAMMDYRAKKYIAEKGLYNDRV